VYPDPDGEAYATVNTTPTTLSPTMINPVKASEHRCKPAEHGLPFSTWSLVKLADFLVAEGVVDDISIEGLPESARRGGGFSPAENLEDVP
jgi:hypothetical protein